MNFNEKLQLLRKQHDITQEQLAEKLYVSRTAVSKWESGKGYPNIESLKYLSKIFSVSIDELLSNDELLTLAETENRSNMKQLYGFISGIIDVMALACILLPLYGEAQGDFIYAVNLLTFDGATHTVLVAYWIIFLALIGLGITKLLLVRFEKDAWFSRISKCSLGLGAVALCLFTVTREPYVTLLLFLFFVVKVYLLVKQTKMK